MKYRDLIKRLKGVENKIMNTSVDALGGDPVKGHGKLLAYSRGDRSVSFPDPDIKAYRRWVKHTPPGSPEAIRRGRKRARQEASLKGAAKNKQAGEISDKSDDWEFLD